MLRRTVGLFCWVSVVAFALLLTSPAVFHAAPADSTWRIVRKLPLGTPGKFDYTAIDSVARRVYYPRTSHLLIIDLDSGKVIHDMPDMKGVHGMAIAPELNRGFSTGDDNSIPIFDLKTFQVIQTVTATGDGPDSIAYDPVTKRAFSSNGRGKNVTAIDGATGNIVGTVALDGNPNFLVVDGKGNVFITVRGTDASKIEVFDGKTLQVTHNWPATPCVSPTGLALDTAHHRIFTSCQGNKGMTVMNSDTGEVITTLPIGTRTDGAGFDPSTGTIIVTCAGDEPVGDGIINVFHEDSPDKYSTIGEIHTTYGVLTNALDTKTHHFWAATTTVTNPPPAPTEARPHPTSQPDWTTFVAIEIGQ
jgi:DNA-binding beta-propeller fold protein YncE